MKFVIDMNLSPQWCAVFEAEGWAAEHWPAIGPYSATDREIMEWAIQHGCVVFTHDLDFGAMLAGTRATAPSVVQIRAQDVLPGTLGPRVTAIIRSNLDTLKAGALMVIDESRSRLRILPLRPSLE